MLTVVVPACELWDSAKQEFTPFGGETLYLEHSLVSISKWEAETNKPFLSRDKKTEADVRNYARCMTINKNVAENTYAMLTPQNLKAIAEYIDAPMSAVRFKKNTNEGPPSRETITSELIYYWMVALNIPFSCEKWHLNRLMNLIRICNIKNKPAKKRSSSELLRERSALNAQRKAKLHTSG